MKLTYVLPSAERSRLVEPLVAGLAARGHHVNVLVAGTQGPLSDWLLQVGVTVEHLDLRPDLRSPRLLFDVGAMRRAAAAGGSDVVHANGYVAGLLTCLPGLPPLGAPLVLSRHHNAEHHLLGVRRHVLLDAWCAKRAQTVVAVSHSVRTTLVREGVPTDRIRVVPNAVDWERLQASPDRTREWRKSLAPGGALFVAAGRIDPIKDYPTMLTAFELVRRRLPHAVLAIAGEGAHAATASVTALADSLGIEDSVRLLGHVDDLPSLTAAADVFVHSSKDEAFGLVVLEALGLGVPVASTAGGALAHLLDGRWPTAPVGDAVRLSEIMLSLQKPGSTKRAQAIARQVRGEYSVQRLVAGHVDAYESAVGRSL